MSLQLPPPTPPPLRHPSFLPSLVVFLFSRESSGGAFGFFLPFPPFRDWMKEIDTKHENRQIPYLFGLWLFLLSCLLDCLLCLLVSLGIEVSLSASVITTWITYTHLLFVNVGCFFSSGLREFDACNQASMMRINSPILSVGVFSFLEGYEGVFDPSKQAKHDNLTTNHNDFCMFFCYNFLPRLKPGVFCSWKQEWYIIIIYFFCPLLLKLGCFSSSFLLPFWFVCFSLLAWFYSSTHQSLHDSSSTSSSAVLPFVSGLQ